jgi:methyl-accepting chemotaxis protein
VARLARELEKRIDFVSLEYLTDRQLVAIKEQTAQQQLLNTQLIAELSKPLERITATGTEAIGGMVNELGRNLTSSVGQSLDRMAERIDAAASSLTTLASSLGEASERFRETLDKSVVGFDGVARKVETVSEALTTSAQSVASTAAPVMETARATADTARALADGSIKLVDAAKVTVDTERTVVVASAKSIEELIRAFETRAKAYDGQLEKAFTTYVEQVQRTLGELRTHSDGVHDRYAEALQVLQAVIENARTFVPESAPPPDARPPSGGELQ